MFKGMQLSQVRAWAVKIQDSTQNYLTCRRRSYERVPPEVRELWAAASQAPAANKSQLRKQAQQKLVACRKAVRRDTLSQAMQKGKIPVKETKMHEIKEIILPQGPSQEPDIWAPKVQALFEHKWACSDSKTLQKILNVSSGGGKQASRHVHLAVNSRQMRMAAAKK